MDGDVAPLAEIVELAHASTTRGSSSTRRTRPAASARAGAARVAEAGLEGEVDVVIGTLGKALGSYGAYVCGERGDGPLPGQHGALADLLDRARRRPRWRARWPRWSCWRSARTASSGCAPTRARCARALAAEGFPVDAEAEMHIVPLIVGDERDAMRLCQEALERGVFAQAIRPPTVPAGTSRLRLAAMASHTADRAARWRPARSPRRRSAASARPAGDARPGARARRVRRARARARRRAPSRLAPVPGRRRRRARAPFDRRSASRPAQAAATVRRRARARSRGLTPPARAPRAMRGPVRHRHRHRRRQDGPERRAARGDGGGGRAGRGLQAGPSPGLDEPARRPGVAARPRAARARRRHGAGESRRCASAPRSRHIWPPSWRASRSTPRTLLAASARRRGDARRRTLIVEGVGGLLVPLAEDLRAAISRSRSACRVWSPRARASARSTTRC